MNRCTTGNNCQEITCSGCFPETQEVVEVEEIPVCEDCGNHHIGECNRFEEEYHLGVCENCGKTSRHLQRCRGCNDVYYCDRVCQREHWNLEHRYTCDRHQTNTRKKFKTPCGQTYWTDSDYLIYTNKHVETPIGYWCKNDQAIYFTNELSDVDSDDSEDDYDYGTPPPTPPPTYEESNDISDDEVDGEIIVCFQSN